MRYHHLHGRPGRSGGWQQSHQPDASDAADWFAGRVPGGWFSGDPTVVVDREEITVIGRLAEPEGSESPESEARASGRAARFREETRPERMRIADEAEDRYGRKVSWGVEVGPAGSTERMVSTEPSGVVSATNSRGPAVSKGSILRGGQACKGGARRTLKGG